MNLPPFPDDYIPTSQEARRRLIAWGEECARMGAEAERAWKDAVLDHLAICCLDAPLDEPPDKIIGRVIDWHVAVATDPLVNAGMALWRIQDGYGGRRIDAASVCHEKDKPAEAGLSGESFQTPVSCRSEDAIIAADEADHKAATRSQRLLDAGYTRRPTWKSLPLEDGPRTLPSGDHACALNLLADGTCSVCKQRFGNQAQSNGTKP